MHQCVNYALEYKVIDSIKHARWLSCNNTFKLVPWCYRLTVRTTTSHSDGC